MLHWKGDAGMSRLWMRSLTGQWILLMLLALLMSQLLFYFIYRAEQARAVLELRRDEVLARATSVATLVETVDPALFPVILRATNTGVVRFWLEDAEAAPNPVTWQEKARQHLLESPRPPAASEIQVQPKVVWETTPTDGGGDKQPMQMLNLKAWNGFGLIIAIRDNLSLHTVYAKPQSLAGPPWSYYLSLIITALLLSLVSVLVARRVGRPLQKLTDSAERLGRGEEVEPLPEAGADDIRRTAAAFNRMQLRLRRFVEDRTRMMAAISHDLRTPITSMRLRAEFLKDEETKRKFIASLDEMQTMTESTMAFAREESASEPTRIVDLNALIESLCFDLADLGWDVSYNCVERLPWRCRPNALRRALRNVIENAVRYGDRARVHLVPDADGVAVIVDDDGTGIAAADHERVFDPFVRLEGSRNRNTGGVGLGLSIARSILRSHGGDIKLAEGDTGLRVCMRLPEKHYQGTAD